MVYKEFYMGIQMIVVWFNQIVITVKFYSLITNMRGKTKSKPMKKELKYISNPDLKNEVLKIISDHRIGVLSSVENNKPQSRYMTLYSQDLTLFTPTKMDTEKVEEIEKNPSVSVL